MRRLKQIGVDHVLTGGPRSRGTKPTCARGSTLQGRRHHALQHDDLGLRRRDLGPSGRRREDRAVISSIRAAGRAGLPVVEYNFYANRLMEGYKEETGRAGAATRRTTTRCRRTCSRRKASARTPAPSSSNAPSTFSRRSCPRPRRPTSAWRSIPTIRPCRSAAAPSRSWPRSRTGRSTSKLVDSPFNGMTFDCGVTREMGEDPVAVCRWLGERDRINHVHFRNVVVRKPYVDYTEVFLDDGQVDMFAVMRELVRQKYPRGDLPGASARHRRRSRAGPDPQSVSRRRRLCRRDLQRRLHAGDAAGGADSMSASARVGTRVAWRHVLIALGLVSAVFYVRLAWLPRASCSSSS